MIKMIDIRSLASGSSGNCYWVSDGTQPLLLECGIRYKEIQEGINFRVSDLAGCLITHEHGDHCKAVKKLMAAGVNVYTSQGTIEALDVSGHRIIPVKEKQLYRVDNWFVKPFKTEHDAVQPLGYLIQNRIGDRLLFATDTFYVRYLFPGLTHIMIECNYALDILKENVKYGRVLEVQKNRVLKSHFSLKNVKEFLKANDLSRVREIWLLHLSDDNSDAGRFKKEIQGLTGKPVYIAGGE